MSKSKDPTGLKKKLLLIFLDVCKGVWFIHHKGFIHRDLKPDNIFLKTNDDPSSERKEVAKIGDLGTTKEIQFTVARTKVATKLYAAPEFFIYDTVGQDFDTWSLGVILYEIMTLCKPFKNEKRIKKIKYDRKLIGDKQIRNIVEHIF